MKEIKDLKEFDSELQELSERIKKLTEKLRVDVAKEHGPLKKIEKLQI